jgi:hypothetical protein
MRFRRAELSVFLSPFVCVLAAALTTFSSAQQPAVQTIGQIAGTVTDADGAVVTNANIALESQLNHQQYTSKSDDTGFFNFTAQSPGVFHITISAKGFADWTATDVILKPGQDYELADITLKIPSVNVSVQALTQHESSRAGQSGRDVANPRYRPQLLVVLMHTVSLACAINQISSSQPEHWL